MARRILLAENDVDFGYIINAVLSDAGYDVERLFDGTDIVEGKHEWPDLFILDMELPTIDGFALSKYLKLKKETKDIPIIMISSYHHLKTKATKLGINDFIEKPFDLKVLLKSIQYHVNDNRDMN